MDRPLPELDPEKRAAILRSFFTADGRLIGMPSKLSKRLVVLDHIASRFEVGRVHSESEVNRRLQAVHHDYAMLRRYLIDWDFLSRADGKYWRTGGTVDV